jgi:hypothetical protein
MRTLAAYYEESATVWEVQREVAVLTAVRMAWDAARSTSRLSGLKRISTTPFHYRARPACVTREAQEEIAGRVSLSLLLEQSRDQSAPSCILASTSPPRRVTLRPSGQSAGQRS